MNRNRYVHILILAACTLTVFFSYRAVIQPRKDFYNNLWAPAHLLVRGESPYNTASLAPDLPAVWMPMAVGMFFPLGFLPPETASSIWFLLNAVGLNTLVLLSLPKPRSIGAVAAGILFAALFPPFFHHTMLGQISILSTLFLLVAARFAEKRWDWGQHVFSRQGYPNRKLAFSSCLGLACIIFSRGDYN